MRRRCQQWNVMACQTYINAKHSTFSQSSFCSCGVDMSWLCSFCDKSFSIKYNMQRHLISKYRNASLTPFHTVSMPLQNCQRFCFEHPFTCMVAGMTGSGKTAWVPSLLQQASEGIYLPSETIVWCDSQWQPAYTKMLYHTLHLSRVFLRLWNKISVLM